MFLNLGNEKIREYLTQAEFGIERESLRVCENGTLAQSPHPFDHHKNIDRDFCENQIEIIGDVFTDPEQLNEQLLQLQKIINGRLQKNKEVLWPFSNPPKISSEEEIPVAEYVGSLQSKSVYRHYLAGKYGKRKMLFSGIHLNFSFSEQFLQFAFTQSGETDFTAFKNHLYLHLAGKLTAYAWLVVYLMSASPVADDTIGTPNNVYSSIRCSEKGYWNYFVPVFDYTDLDSYIRSIQRYIDDGNLRSVSELYYPVRVKPRGANSLEILAQNGINHLELRVIDVNPLSPTGIFTEDIRFIHLLMLYLVSLPKREFTGKEQVKAVRDVKTASVFGNAEIRQRAIQTLSEIRGFARQYFPQYSDIMDRQLSKTEQGGSYAEIVSRQFGEDYMTKGLKLAKDYQRSVGYV